MPGHLTRSITVYLSSPLLSRRRLRLKSLNVRIWLAAHLHALNNQTLGYLAGVVLFILVFCSFCLAKVKASGLKTVGLLGLPFQDPLSLRRVVVVERLCHSCRS
jgi:hypothetical protein